MGKKYAVPNCLSGYRSNKEKVSVFSTPKNKLLEWQRAIPRANRSLEETDLVCAKHFLKEDIITEVKGPVIRYVLFLTILYKFPCKLVESTVYTRGTP